MHLSIFPDDIAKSSRGAKGEGEAGGYGGNVKVGRKRKRIAVGEKSKSKMRRGEEERTNERKKEDFPLRSPRGRRRTREGKRRRAPEGAVDMLDEPMTRVRANERVCVPEGEREEEGGGEERERVRARKQERKIDAS